MRYLKLELTVLVILVAVGLLVGLMRSPSVGEQDKEYEVVGADLEPFRSAFNAAADNVRAVLLVAPT